MIFSYLKLIKYSSANKIRNACISLISKTTFKNKL